MEPYPMKWFRLYDEALNDPKVQRLPDAAFKCWINLLCLANQGKPRGRIKREDISYALRMTEERTEKMITYFMDHGFLEQDGQLLVPHAWDARQFISDNVTERTRKHRGNVPGTLQGTPPDTDTDTEQNQSRTEPPNPRGKAAEIVTLRDMYFDEFWKIYPKGRGSKKLSREQWHKLKPDEWQAILQVLPLFAASGAWQREGGKYVKLAEGWLRNRGWEDDVPPEKPTFHSVGQELMAMEAAKNGHASGVRGTGRRWTGYGYADEDPIALLDQNQPGDGPPQHGDDGRELASGAGGIVDASFRVGPH